MNRGDSIVSAQRWYGGFRCIEAMRIWSGLSPAALYQIVFLEVFCQLDGAVRQRDLLRCGSVPVDRTIYSFDVLRYSLGEILLWSLKALLNW